MRRGTSLRPSQRRQIVPSHGCSSVRVGPLQGVVAPWVDFVAERLCNLRDKTSSVRNYMAQLEALLRARTFPKRFGHTEISRELKKQLLDAIGANLRIGVVNSFETM